MQDPKGLIAAMGGKEKFLKNLNGLFSQPEKVEGLGFVLGAPQVPKVVLHIPGAAETAAPHTVGSRSVATADAINCVPPAAADAQEHVPPRTFTIIAKNLSKENKYVKSITLNGKPLTGKAAVPAAEVPILRHADIMRGGELVFEMVATP